MLTLLYHDPNNHGKTYEKKPMGPMGHCNWATTRQVSPPSAQATVQRPAASEMVRHGKRHGKPGILPRKIGISQGFHWISCGNPQDFMPIKMYLTIRKVGELPVGQSTHKNDIGNGWSQELYTVEICWFVILGPTLSFPYHLWGYHINSHDMPINSLLYPRYITRYITRKKGPFMLHLNQF